MRTVTLYIDFISPFSYLALHRLRELPPDVAIEYRPVLFAGLLKHHGQKGPAEIPAKRRYTYRWVHWWAQRLGIRLRFPAGHPFNALPHLRLAIAAGSTRAAILKIFESLWTEGGDAADPARYHALCRDLGVSQEALDTPDVKDRLRKNTEEAAARGIFRVPSFEVDGEVFWGADSMEFLCEFLADPAVLRNAEMLRLDRLPVAAARRTNG